MERTRLQLKSLRKSLEGDNSIADLDFLQFKLYLTKCLQNEVGASDFLRQIHFPTDF